MGTKLAQSWCWDTLCCAEVTSPNRRRRSSTSISGARAQNSFQVIDLCHSFAIPFTLHFDLLWDSIYTDSLEIPLIAKAHEAHEWTPKEVCGRSFGGCNKQVSRGLFETQRFPADLSPLWLWTNLKIELIRRQLPFGYYPCNQCRQGPSRSGRWWQSGCH